MDIFNFAENKSVTQCPIKWLWSMFQRWYVFIGRTSVYCEGEFLSCKIH